MSGSVLSSQEINAKLLEQGVIFTKGDLDKSRIKPASMDICFGDEAFELEATFLPEAGRAVFDQIKDRTKRRFSLNNGARLEVGNTYAIPLQLGIDLRGDREGIQAKFNPRSRMGRIDFFLRALLDGVRFYDKVPANYKGDVFVLAQPCSFPIIAYPGVPAVQARFYTGDPFLTDTQIRRSMNNTREIELYEGERRLFSSDIEIRDGVTNTVDLKGQILGFKSKKFPGRREEWPAIDLKKEGAHDVLDYFEVIVDKKDGILVLDPETFYLFQTVQGFKMAPNLCADIAATDAAIGEFRSHYAGFVDPGFTGTITLEMRVFSRTELRHGQPVCRTIYEAMEHPAEVEYGDSIGSAHYKQSHPNPGAYFDMKQLKSLI